MHVIRTTLAIALVTLLAIFIFSNTQSVSVNLVVFKLEAPIALVVLFSAMAGAPLWPLMRSILRRSAQKR